MAVPAVFKTLGAEADIRRAA